MRYVVRQWRGGWAVLDQSRDTITAWVPAYDRAVVICTRMNLA